MKSHWEQVIKVFQALSYILKEVDPDGLDLHFTISGDSLKNCKTTSKPVQLLKSRRHQGNTDINLKLTAFFEDYKATLDKSRGLGGHLKKKKRPLSLYILTDGVWERECNPEKPIRNMAQKLAELGKDKSQLGIQFISFGNIPVGRLRLEQLDNCLGLEP